MRSTARDLTLALVAVLCSGCVPTPTPTTTPIAVAPPSTQIRSPSPAQTRPPSPAPTQAPTASPSPTPTPTRTATPTPKPSCAEATLASMTDAQRIGQLFMIGLTKDQLTAAETAAISTYHFGSMVFTTKTTEGVAAVRAVTDAVQALATRNATAGVRFFIAANQEGGLIQALAGPGFDTIPSAVVQGVLTAAALRHDAAIWGAELHAAGVNLDLAPVSDVVPPGTDAHNAPIGQLKREYGHDPATVARAVAAFVVGLHASGVATSAKHFPGLGRVGGNTDVTSAVIDTVTTRHDPYLQPFAAAIDAGVPFVMVSLATYERMDPANLAVFSKTIIGGVLRGDLGFRGVVISDSLGATAVTAIAPATRAIDFLEAGGDMIIVNRLADADPMAKGLAARVAASPAFADRVAGATLRVLRAKDAAGLLTCSG